MSHNVPQFIRVNYHVQRFKVWDNDCWSYEVIEEHPGLIKDRYPLNAFTVPGNAWDIGLEQRGNRKMPGCGYIDPNISVLAISVLISAKTYWQYKYRQ